MTKINQSFQISIGDRQTLRVTIFDSDGVTPLDLSGGTVEWELALDEFSLPIITKTSATPGEIDIPTPTNGIINIELKPDDTKALAEGVYFHESELNSPGATFTVFSGFATLEAVLQVTA